MLTYMWHYHFLFRLGFLARNYDPPRSHTGVAKMVKEYAKEVKAMNKKVIQRFIKEDFRFAITLDEYTRLGNRKLMNVNLHLPDGDFLRIGMIRIRGSMPAEVAQEILTKKLEDYKIDIKKDVIAPVTDGASVCKKLGRLLKIPHILCMSHGMHLAVCDVLYERKASNKNENEDEEDENELEDEEDEPGADWLDEAEEEPQLIVYTEIIEKVRKIVRKFRRSTVNNDELQKKVTEQLGKEKMLQIDVK